MPNQATADDCNDASRLRVRAACTIADDREITAVDDGTGLREHRPAAAKPGIDPDEVHRSPAMRLSKRRFVETHWPPSFSASTCFCSSK